jgi:hypothetical protein
LEGAHVLDKATRDRWMGQRASQHKIIALRHPYARLLVCRKLARACVGTYVQWHEVLSTVICGCRTTRRSACLTLNPGERAGRFPRREARTRFTADRE